ncbi:hypothetical protein [Corynebacterium sp.]|uniref:hypothetical protein n=1 Tax=Corynebacterium sp. TaxID=1720 RepID=UPI0028AD3382|nr:hypothetical protein [Corynebacterium sp.]
MKITKFVPEYDSETRRNNWSMEVVADGRTWTLKGCTTQDGTHSFGVTRAKDNLPYGVHYASQMAREIREFVIETLDADLLMRERLLTPTDVSASEPECQHPILTLETRAVLAHLVEELQAEFFTRETEAREGYYEMTHLEATSQYAAARGFEAAIDYLMNEFRTVTASKKRLEEVVSKRRVCELDPNFCDIDLVLNSLNQSQKV